MVVRQWPGTNRSARLARCIRSRSAGTERSNSSRTPAFGAFYGVSGPFRDGACRDRTGDLRLAKRYLGLPAEPGEAGIGGHSRDFVRWLAGIARSRWGRPALSCGICAGWDRCLTSNRSRPSFGALKAPREPVFAKAVVRLLGQRSGCRSRRPGEHNEPRIEQASRPQPLLPRREAPL
jgi:hypothetical protein